MAAGPYNPHSPEVGQFPSRFFTDAMGQETHLRPTHRLAAVVTSGVSHRCAPGAKPVGASRADAGIHGRRKTCGHFWADSGIHGRRKTCGSFWSRATVAMAVSGDALNSPSPATHPPAGGGNRAVHPGHNAGFRRTAGSRCRACSPPPALRCRRRRPRTRRCRT
jgi:hypothetical protein